MHAIGTYIPRRQIRPPTVTNSMEMTLPNNAEKTICLCHSSFLKKDLQISSKGVDFTYHQGQKWKGVTK